MFGFSSASTFVITDFARRAIAVGSVASGIGLSIDAWFLLVYCNAPSAKFQVSPPFSMQLCGLTSRARNWPQTSMANTSSSVFQHGFQLFACLRPLSH